ncbi:MAG TPA: hypothetical protein VMR28_02175 [Candidatus Saccharimonadales bacterium]|nr:hypothetical protein [Candidatus Saccharimonadales bacterium]
MRYFVSFLIAIGLIVLVFILILKSFGGGKSALQSQAKPLVDYSNTNVVAEFDIQGPVVYDQSYQEIHINVDQQQTQINIQQGYQGEIVNTQAFPSNQNAYAVFLRSLDLLGFTEGNPDPADTDDRGFCPFGERYVYQLVNGSQTIQHYWATSCGGQGTFKGNVSSVNTLFEAQIPNYGQLTSSIVL